MKQNKIPAEEEKVNNNSSLLIVIHKVIIDLLDFYNRVTLLLHTVLINLTIFQK